MKKILIFHYRVGRTDGVSLEIANWKVILEREGWEVLLCSGPVSGGADYVIDDLEMQLNPTIFNLDEEAFGGFKTMTEEEFVPRFRMTQEGLYKEFERVIDQAKPDRVIVSNIFSVGLNVAAAGALAEVLKKKGIRTVAVNHDFYWEDVRYRRPSGIVVERQLEKYFPPAGDWIRQACINSIARNELAKRKGVDATLVYDCMDFSDQDLDTTGIGKKLLVESGVTSDDLVVLQATRIVRRKNIELAMDLVKEMEGRLADFKKKRIVLVLAGYAEKRDLEYLERLRNYARELGIHLVELHGNVLFEVYPYADLVTYPSGYEGFGNQFLEAVHAKKPIVIYEYPVYKTDIKPLGFDVITLGDNLSYDPGTGLAKIQAEVMENAVDEAVSVLTDGNRRKKMVEKNFRLGRDNFSFENTAQVWKSLLTKRN